MVPLMRLGVCGGATLGLGSRWTLVICSVCWLFGLGSMQWVKVTLKVTKVWLRCFHSIDVCFVSRSSFILLILRSVSWLQVARRREDVRFVA